MMHAGQSAPRGRREHWRDHYRREIERVRDAIRYAEARRAAQLKNLEEATTHAAAAEVHINDLKLALDKYQANLQHWTQD